MGRSGRKVAVQEVPDRITVPDLDGVIVAGALRQAELVGFTLVIADPPVDLATLQMSGRWVVAAQEPPAGSQRFRGDTVVVTLRRDGGGPAGDREPRHPLPRRKSDRAPIEGEHGPEQSPPMTRVGDARDRSEPAREATILQFGRPRGSGR